MEEPTFGRFLRECLISLDFWDSRDYTVDLARFSMWEAALLKHYIWARLYVRRLNIY